MLYLSQICIHGKRRRELARVGGAPLIKEPPSERNLIIGFRLLPTLLALERAGSPARGQLEDLTYGFKPPLTDAKLVTIRADNCLP